MSTTDYTGRTVLLAAVCSNASTRLAFVARVFCQTKGQIVSPPQLILIPGLGADRDLFYPQQQHFGERLSVLDGPADAALWQQKPSMDAAAEAFLPRLACLLDGQSDYVLGGMSFGGSLAVEMARRIARQARLSPPRSLALIASNRTAGTISRGFRINRLLGAAVPRPLVRGSLRSLAGLFARREGLPPEDAQRLRDMAGRTNIDHLMWGAQAIAGWRCEAGDLPTAQIPIHQIHGRHDWVIRHHDSHVTSTLEEGRHLITWTHRTEVDQWLSSLLPA